MVYGLLGREVDETDLCSVELGIDDFGEGCGLAVLVDIPLEVCCG